MEKDNRTWIEVNRSNLQSSLQEQKITNIQFESKTNYVQLRRHLEVLSAAGLIKKLQEGYLTTERGKSYIDLARRIKDLEKPLSVI